MKLKERYSANYHFFTHYYFLPFFMSTSLRLISYFVLQFSGTIIFQGFDWSGLTERNLKPPINPVVLSSTDTSNFDRLIVLIFK